MKRNYIIVSILVVVVLIAAGMLLQLKHKYNLGKIAPPVSDSSPIQSADQAYYLTCRIATSEIENTFEELSDEVTILRMAPCVYRRSDGTVESVEVPLAFYNLSLQQFFVLNSTVKNMEKPGDPYIDTIISKLFESQPQDPVVSLYMETDPNQLNPQFVSFISSATLKLGDTWQKGFAQSENAEQLPKTKSGKPLFLANGIIFVAHD